MKKQVADSAASTERGTQFVSLPIFRLRSQRSGMTSMAAAAIANPKGENSGLALTTRKKYVDGMAITGTSATRRSAETKADRSPRCLSPAESFLRWDTTTVAETSSTRLSEPNAISAKLSEIRPTKSAPATSTDIHATLKYSSLRACDILALLHPMCCSEQQHAAQLAQFWGDLHGSHDSSPQRQTAHEEYVNRIKPTSRGRPINCSGEGTDQGSVAKPPSSQAA